MGRVITVGLKVDCDRCKKVVDVNDHEQEAFYKSFIDKKQPDDVMFEALGNFPGGEKHVRLEIICPDCVSAVGNYLARTDVTKPKGPRQASDKAAETTATGAATADVEEPKDASASKEPATPAVDKPKTETLRPVDKPSAPAKSAVMTPEAESAAAEAVDDDDDDDELEDEDLFDKNAA
jgi:hypothetical protein